MEAEAEAVIFFIVEAEAEALEKSNASATLVKTLSTLHWGSSLAIEGFRMAKFEKSLLTFLSSKLRLQKCNGQTKADRYLTIVNGLKPESNKLLKNLRTL